MGLYSTFTIKSVVRETDDAVTLVFDNSVQHVQARPGQFLTLILPVNGETLRRSYSLCSYSGTDRDLAITVKRVPNGKVSNYILEHAKAGTRVEVMEPMGTFTITTDYNNNRDVVLIGAGSGITPLMAIAKAVLKEEPLSRLYLLYGNRNERSVIFDEQLKSMKEEHGDRFTLIKVFSQPLSNVQYTGRLNRSLILKLLESLQGWKPERSEFFICGPKGMMDEAIDALQVLRIDPEKIHKESFLTSNPAPASGKIVADQPDGPKTVTIIYQGSEYKVKVPVGQSILEAALDNNIDLPFSCQSGMCTACMGKCTSGKVHLDDPDGLSQKEIDQGFVLTCVGHPVSENVIIEID